MWVLFIDQPLSSLVQDGSFRKMCDTTQIAHDAARMILDNLVHYIERGTCGSDMELHVHRGKDRAGNPGYLLAAGIRTAAYRASNDTSRTRHHVGVSVALIIVINLSGAYLAVVSTVKPSTSTKAFLSFDSIPAPAHGGQWPNNTHEHRAAARMYVSVCGAHQLLSTRRQPATAPASEQRVALPDRAR
jgi:hypothetical protein